MKTLIISLLASASILSFGDDLPPSIDRHAPRIDPNPYTFGFVLAENRIFIHNKVRFTEEQFLALAKSIYKARPSARISVVAQDGISFPIDDPAI